MKTGKRTICSTICSIILACLFGTSIITTAANVQDNRTNASPTTSMSDINLGNDSEVVYDQNGKAIAIQASYLDVNGDSKVSVADAVALARFVAEIPGLEYNKIPDPDQDEVVTILDVYFILK